MLELAHHGCAEGVVSLQVPTDAAGLNLGHALLRFAPAYAAQCRQALAGACFHLAPAALPMSLNEVHVQGQPQQVPLARIVSSPSAASPSLRAEAPAFVPLAAPVNHDFEPFSFADQLVTDSDPACEPAAPVTPQKLPKAQGSDSPSSTAWERYAALLATVPQEEWDGALLLEHFGSDELEEMQAMALATLRDTRESLGRYAALGIDLEDEAHDGGAGTAKAEAQPLQPLNLWPDGCDTTPQYNVAWRPAAGSPSAAETPVLKAQTLIKHAAPQSSATPPTRSHSSGSSRSTSPCETPCDHLARVPHTPFDLGRGPCVTPSPATPPSEKRVRFAEEVHTLPFHTDSPAYFSCRALPSPPPSGP